MIKIRILLVVFLIGIIPSFSKRALLMMDIQVDNFGPNGTFPISNANEIVSSLNLIRNTYDFDLVVLTKILNCKSQVSFASRYPGVPLFSRLVLNYDKSGNLCSYPNNSSGLPLCTSLLASLHETLLPNYSVSGTPGSEIHSSLIQSPNDVIITRGPVCDLSWHSAFSDNLGMRSTALDGILRTKGINTIFLGGFGYETSLYFTAKQAKKLGYDVFLIEYASGAFVTSSIPTINVDLSSRGVFLINSLDIPYAIKIDNSNIVKTKFPNLYFKLDLMATWQVASDACYPNRLCYSSEYCPSNSPFRGPLSPGTWSPVFDTQNQWVYLGTNSTDTSSPYPHYLTPSTTCSLFSTSYNFYPSRIQVDSGILMLCCYSNQTLTPSPTSTTLNYPSTTPTINTPVKSPDAFVYQDNLEDSQPQTTRIALIACLCLGLGVTSGIAFGCYLGRKSVAMPKFF